MSFSNGDMVKVLNWGKSYPSSQASIDAHENVAPEYKDKAVSGSTTLNPFFSENESFCHSEEMWDKDVDVYMVVGRYDENDDIPTTVIYSQRYDEIYSIGEDVLELTRRYIFPEELFEI